ncbi:hypothetical protein PPGU19_008040 [Paraburkholderia sp. PGU19]|nr:hypothetical protein PPGU19_008040 [Paraburkholderia sp. PGU19]
MSTVHHAADMLTVQFGLLREVSNFKGAVKHVGQWALHVQCDWQIERNGKVLATQGVLAASVDEAQRRAAESISDLLVGHERTIVESILANESGDVQLILSEGTRMIVTSGRTPEYEDWRLFEPGSDARHFVIEGGKIDPYSLP